MSETGFLLQSKHKIELDITPDAEVETYELLASGITGLDPDVNDEISQDRYMDGDGFAESDVTGAQLVLPFSGHRKYGDPVQDYIYSLVLEIGPSRRTSVKWTLPDGAMFEGSVTITGITGPSGEAGEKGEIGFELHFNGKPEFVPAG